jgi:hypothetical protein
VLAMAREISNTLFSKENLVKDFFRPYLYLDANLIKTRGLDRQVVAAAIAGELTKIDVIGGAIANNNSVENNLSGAGAAIQHNNHPLRSGDIYVFQRPYWFMFDRGAVAAMHGSPWRYDTHVPIIFAGQGIKPAQVDRLVHPIDVAPTQSALLRITAPAGAEGSVLQEVLQP